MDFFTSVEDCRKAAWEYRRRGVRLGLVPTMGALHRGHLSLVEAARKCCDRVFVSIFVNPTQFGPAEDFDAYPRPLEDDLSKCRAAGVDVVFAPSVEAMYGSQPKTTIHVRGLTDHLCGPHRPGHFDGVATVVAKLFNIIPADTAFFGEKDYQQLIVIREMARDLDVPMVVAGCSTVREPDGLAMSSRNAYLSPNERSLAVSLSRALFDAQRACAAGDKNAAVITAGVRNAFQSSGIQAIDYVEVVDARTLEPLNWIDREARLCVAVRIGKTRLIDNVAL